MRITPEMPMPVVTDPRDRRLEEIRGILRAHPVRTQAELVGHLERRGFQVTQASVSRDLRDLHVAKEDGVYRLIEAEAGEGAHRLRDSLARAIRRMRPAGPHLLVLQTEVGAASRVALALDETGWREILGTVAGDDTVFVATGGTSEQRRVTMRLEQLQEA